MTDIRPYGVAIQQAAASGNLAQRPLLPQTLFVRNPATFRRLLKY